MKKKKRRIDYNIKLVQWLNKNKKYKFMVIFKSETFKYILIDEITEVELFELGIEFGKFDSQIVG